MKKLLKIIFIIISVIAISITAYYYVYMGYINTSNVTEEKIIFKDVIKEEKVKEEKFHIIKDLMEKYSNSDVEHNFLSNQITAFYNNNMVNSYKIELVVNDPITINHILEQYFPNINKNSTDKKNLFKSNDKIDIIGIEKTKDIYELEITITRENNKILNGIFIINNKNGILYIKKITNLDIFFLYINNEGLNNYNKNNLYIDYDIFNNIYIDYNKVFIYIDYYLGQTKYDNLFKIIESLEEFIDKYSNTNSSTLSVIITPKMKPYVINQILDSNITDGQKTNINNKIGLLIDTMNGTQITLNKNLLLIKNTNKQFIFDYSIKVSKIEKFDSNITSFEYNKLLLSTYTNMNSMKDIIDTFWKRNEVLKMYLNDMSLSKYLLYS